MVAAILIAVTAVAIIAIVAAARLDKGEIDTEDRDSGNPWG